MTRFLNQLIITVFLAGQPLSLFSDKKETNIELRIINKADQDVTIITVPFHDISSLATSRERSGDSTYISSSSSLYSSPSKELKRSFPFIPNDPLPAAIAFSYLSKLIQTEHEYLIIDDPKNIDLIRSLFLKYGYLLSAKADRLGTEESTEIVIKNDLPTLTIKDPLNPTEDTITVTPRKKTYLFAFKNLKECFDENGSYTGKVTYKGYWEYYDSRNYIPDLFMSWFNWFFPKQYNGWFEFPKKPSQSGFALIELHSPKNQSDKNLCDVIIDLRYPVPDNHTKDL